jgi:hypothetical protein
MLVQNAKDEGLKQQLKHTVFVQLPDMQVRAGKI